MPMPDSQDTARSLAPPSPRESIELEVKVRVSSGRIQISVRYEYAPVFIGYSDTLSGAVSGLADAMPDIVHEAGRIDADKRLAKESMFSDPEGAE